MEALMMVLAKQHEELAMTGIDEIMRSHPITSDLLKTLDPLKVLEVIECVLKRYGNWKRKPPVKVTVDELKAMLFPVSVSHADRVSNVLERFHHYLEVLNVR